MLCCTASKFGLTLLVGVAAGFMINASVAPTKAIQPEGEQPSMEEMWAEMARLGTPGEHHEKLSRTVGEWNVESSFNMPGQPPMVSSGSMSCQWVLDGRFVKTDFHLPDMMGQPFHGIGYNGYDNGSEKFIGVWMDNMSTMAFVTEGKLMDDGSFEWVGPNSMGGKMKIVQTMPDKDTLHDTFYDSMDGGKTWTESGTMHYTRK